MIRPSHLLLLITALSLVKMSHTHARTFTRCQLSRELLRYNFPRSLIPNWVCLIEHASGRTTEKITNHNNAYTSYGLFQTVISVHTSNERSERWEEKYTPPELALIIRNMINNKEWCKKGRKGGHCNMKCEDLLNEDLADDVRCAKRVYDRAGFRAWPSSYSYCKEKSLPDLSRC